MLNLDVSKGIARLILHRPDDQYQLERQILEEFNSPWGYINKDLSAHVAILAAVGLNPFCMMSSNNPLDGSKRPYYRVTN